MQFYTQYILNLSISKHLLVKAVNYAKELVGIGEKEGKRIIHSQKSFLLNNLDIWVKKVGDQDNGLCKDNGLGHFENIGGPTAERIWRDVTDLFKRDFQLNINSKTYLKVINFLDVTFNLTTGKYQPYENPVMILCTLM